MRWPSRRRLLAAGWLVLALRATDARAQQPGWHETQLQVFGIASRPAFGGAGGGLAWRDAQRNRWQVALNVGALEGGRAAARADVVYHFLLNPARRQGSAVYGGGGLSALAAAGRVTPFVVLVVGVENAPGGSGGSFVEVGLGGGVRAAIGYRWRKRNAPGR